MSTKAAECVESASSDSKHTMIYGACSSANRSYALELLRPLSPSELRYERKISYRAEKHNVNIMVSDVHYEVDMSLLGRNARGTWQQVYTTIVDSIKANRSKKGIILCKNFESCCADLVRVFFSYLQRPVVLLTPVRFIILTSHCSFIPNSIKLRCHTISLKTNGKARAVKLKWTPVSLCKRILRCITGEVDIPSLRNVLYEVQIYLFSLDKISWCLIQQVVEHRGKCQKPVSCEELSYIVRLAIECCYSYNVCYRPIFHLEKLALGLASIVDGNEHAGSPHNTKHHG